MRAVALAALLPLSWAAPVHADTTEAGTLRLVQIGTFDKPIHALSPPGDASRILVVEQGDSSAPARIRLVRDGQLVPDPFLTVTGVAQHHLEQGLLSMAFAPDYQTSGRLYVFYADAAACTGANCDLRVDEFTRADADHADPDSRREVVSITHRDRPTHNGGQLHFGPDGLLYLAPGDGGGPGDPFCDAQRADSLLGKVLRIDPRVDGAAPEVYASGLRNPFRFSFDRLTGDLLIGDVGQDAQEEVDFLVAGSAPGTNFGWNVFEGAAPYSTDCEQDPIPAYTGPALTYPHPPSGPAAVTGGVVVRDPALRELLGRYLYADFYVGEIRGAFVGPGGASGDTPTGLRVSSLAGFGEDALARVYITSLDGPVYRLESTQPPGAAQPLPPALAIDRVPPNLSRLALLRRRFAVARAGTSVLAGTPQPPRGTAFRYTLSETATVTFRIYRALPGRRRGRRCVLPTRALRRARRCVRYGLAGTLVRRSVRAGRRITSFSGRMGGRALRPGRYRATARARDAAGNRSAGLAVSFTVVPLLSPRGDSRGLVCQERPGPGRCSSPSARGRSARVPLMTRK